MPVYVSDTMWESNVQNQEGKAPRIQSKEEMCYFLYCILFVVHVHILIWQETWRDYFCLLKMSFLPLRSFIAVRKFFTKNSKLTPVFEKMFWSICQSFRVVLLKKYLHNQNILFNNFHISKELKNSWRN